MAAVFIIIAPWEIYAFEMRMMASILIRGMGLTIPLSTLLAPSVSLFFVVSPSSGVTGRIKAWTGDPKGQGTSSADTADSAEAENTSQKTRGAAWTRPCCPTLASFQMKRQIEVCLRSCIGVEGVVSSVSEDTDSWQPWQAGGGETQRVIMFVEWAANHRHIKAVHMANPWKWE